MIQSLLQIYCPDSHLQEKLHCTRWQAILFSLSSVVGTDQSAAAFAISVSLGSRTFDTFWLHNSVIRRICLPAPASRASYLGNML